MISVGWLIGVVLGISVIHYAIVRSLLAQIRSLSRALIANNAKDLTMLDRADATPRLIPRRKAPERAADFTESTLRPMGLG